jgi:hypothetical protein
MQTAPVSDRAKIQDDIAAFLQARSDFFNAPCGILCGLERFPKGGAARVITFGVARLLDARVCILSPRNITITARGGYGTSLAGSYSCVDSVKAALSSVAGW